LADFSANINLDEIVPKGLQDENLALEMVKAGQEILKRTGWMDYFRSWLGHSI